ncbi:cysteine hydrolase family protein [Nocardia sp. CA-120079]|uniref:cysteine hydrolase family protein n=1 Tax=Nocardia sp. CA-120079 TaxID=3239974 RepID=UPI003D98BF52
MPLTEIDAHTALVVVDLQDAVVALPTVHSAKSIVEQSARLADAFRKRNLPVVIVTAAGVAPGRTEASRARAAGGQSSPAAASSAAEAVALLSELGPRPGDHTVVKRVWGAFHDPTLAGWLREREITQVVVTGIATSMGVESTARGAHEYGFNVTIATDAVTDLDQEDHDYALRKVFPKIAETGTTDEILALVESSTINA